LTFSLPVSRCGDLGLFDEAFGVVDCETAHGVGQIGAVDDAEAVAGLEARHGDSGGCKGVGAIHSLAFVEGLTLAHHQQGDLRHGGEIAAGAHRAFAADNRGDSVVEHGDEGSGDFGPAARVAVGVDIDPEQHGGADPVFRTGLADAGGVVVDQVLLEVAHLLI